MAKLNPIIIINPAVPASTVTAGTFGAGNYVFPGTVSVTGQVGIGNASIPSTFLYVNANGMFGAATNGAVIVATFPADTIVTGSGLIFQFRTVAAVFTMTTGFGVSIASPVLGAGSIVTTLVGLKIYDQTGGGTNYAIYTGLGAVLLGDTLAVTGAFGCNGNTPQTKAVSGGTVGGVITALIATGILSS